MQGCVGRIYDVTECGERPIPIALFGIIQDDILFPGRTRSANTVPQVIMYDTKYGISFPIGSVLAKFHFIVPSLKSHSLLSTQSLPS